MISVSISYFSEKDTNLQVWRMKLNSENMPDPISINDFKCGFGLSLSNEQAKDLINKILAVLETENDSNNQI